MPDIVDRKAFNGAMKKIDRLGLRQLWDELEEIFTHFQLNVEESPHANGAAVVREMLQQRFEMGNGWNRRQIGHLYWRKSLTVGSTQVRLGAKIRIAGRSDLSPKDLMVVDVVDLMRYITSGAVDIAVLAVPSDKLAIYIENRTPRFTDAVRAVERSRATDLPLIILALEHDGPGPALPKRRTRQGRAEATEG